MNAANSHLHFSHNYLLAATQKLTPLERANMPPRLMANLAIGGQVVLTRAERDRIPASLLAHLAIGGNCTVDSDAFDRFSASSPNDRRTKRSWRIAKYGKTAMIAQ